PPTRVCPSRCSRPSVTLNKHAPGSLIHRTNPGVRRARLRSGVARPRLQRRHWGVQRMAAFRPPRQHAASFPREAQAMTQGARLVAMIAAAALAPAFASAQTQNAAAVDAVAAKVVQKYQSSTCQQLAQERQAPKTAQKEAVKERVGQLLRQN